jgi:hypothetical protein
MKKSVKKVLVHKKVAKITVKATGKSKKSVKTTLPNITLPATVPSKAMVPTPVPVKVATPVVKKLMHVEVSPDKCFVLCDGRKLKSAKELADTLQTMSDDIFKYHVNDTKNDFANWINDVFGEPDIAKKIRTMRNKMEMSVELYKHMFDKLHKLTKN